MINKTVQRQVILEELRKVKSHPTADEVYESARKRIPNISLATVYRNLEAMANKGDVARLEIAGKKKRYDGDVSQHYHLRCVECGKVVDVSAEEISEAVNALESLKEKEEVHDYSLELRGVCHDCRDKK